MFLRIWLRFCVLICTLGFAAQGQIVGPAGGQALRFNGVDTTVSLPRNLFNGLQDVTVEGWIRFDRFTNYSRFFDIGSAFNSVNVTHFHTSPNLMFEVWESRTNRAAIHVSGLLQTNEWFHLAMVSGRHGMHLFFNGREIASNPSTLGFGVLNTNGFTQLLGVLNTNGFAQLGKSVWDDANVFLSGAMTEFRVWNTTRTATQIADNFRRRITGPEPGLHARWALDGDDGGLKPDEKATIHGEARYIPFRAPEPQELSHPAILTATVLDAAGAPINLAQFRLRTAAGRIVAAGRSGTLGRSELILDEDESSPDPGNRRPTTPGLTNRVARASEIAGNGRFHLAIRQTNQPLSLEVLDPRGSTVLEGLTFSTDERREITIRVPTAGASRDTTNAFAVRLVADLHDPEPWVREMAAIDLASIGHIPHVASAIASVFAFDPLKQVRSTAGQQLERLARQSPVAAAALLEDSRVFRTPAYLRQFQRSLRDRPVPEGLAPIYSRRSLAVSLLFAGILGSFSMLHLFLFLCDHRKHSDGYTALFTGFGVVEVLLAEWNRGDTGPLNWIPLALLSVTYMIGLRLVYNLFAEKISRRYYVLWGICIATVLGLWQGTQAGGAASALGWLAGFVFVVLVASEMLRIAVRAYRARRPGSVLIGCGLLIFYACQFLGPLSAALIDELWWVWLFPAGMTAFVVGASLHLAREFVGTNRALRVAHENISASQQRLANDIQEAVDYVRSLLPEPLTTGPVRTEWVFQPSSELGGDAFGYHWLDADRLVIYLLDVCGHGVGSALLSVSVMNALRTRTRTGVDFANPAAVLTGLNQSFPMDANRGQYFTIWYGVFDRQTRMLRYASAGHPPAFLLVEDRPIVPLRTHGPPIGFLPDAAFKTAETEVPPAALLHVVSDGVYELLRSDEKVATLTDFERDLQTHRWRRPAELLARAMDRTRFKPLDDDLSVLTVTLD